MLHSSDKNEQYAPYFSDFNRSELRPQIQELETKLHSAQAECSTLREEAQKWQARANSMAERTQKINPQVSHVLSTFFNLSIFSQEVMKK
jgi:predicted nuclease with TOPRIM domain